MGFLGNNETGILGMLKISVHFLSFQTHLSKAVLSKSKPGIVSGPVVSASSILSSGPMPGITP